MPFGIELLFDSKTDESIRSMWRRLERKKVSTPLNRDNPHVTLAAFDDGDMRAVEKKCRSIAEKFKPLPACFESIGSFTREGVLFLAPVVTAELLDIHQRVHGSIGSLVRRQSPYYLPGGGWAPHCTLAMAKSNRDYRKGFEVMRRVAIGWKGYFTRLEAHEYVLVKGSYSIRLRTVFSAALRRQHH